jgi:NAD(P)-dependent dehydrogenase (short-subunit alcohol dehydrogenase family)
MNRPNPQDEPARPASPGARDRHALVTGASSGIGQAIARALVEDGWRVTNADRNPPADNGPATRYLQVDLADAQAVRALCDTIEPVDALVHAAGFMRVGRLGQLDSEEGMAMWQVHVRAAEVLVDRLAARLPDGGRIVLMGSRAAQGAAGRSQYAATKAALVGMARCWALELVGRQITVNVIAPGATDTPMLRDPRRATATPVVPPIGRLIEAREVAALAAFLLGPYGGAITGQEIIMCGGASL